DGNVSNHAVLRRRLESLGHRFATPRPEEVVLRAYEAWGDEMLAALEGVFALVLWDARKQRLLAARDRLGVKRLYYTETAEGLALASVPADLVPLTPDREPELAAVAYVLT